MHDVFGQRHLTIETCCKVWIHETHCCSTRHVPRRVPRPCPCTTSVMKSRTDHLLEATRAAEVATQETHYSCTRHIPRRVPRPCPCTTGVMKSRTDHLSAAVRAAECRTPVPVGCDVCNPPVAAELPLFWAVRSRSAYVSSTCRLPLTDCTDNKQRIHEYRQVGTQRHSTPVSTRARNAAEQHNPKPASAHYRTIQWSTIIIYPIRRHSNLTHYTTLALI